MATLEHIADCPSVRSEMRSLHQQGPYLPPEKAWGMNGFRRAWMGARQCTNQVFGMVNNDVGSLKRMSLPAPIASTGEPKISGCSWSASGTTATWTTPFDHGFVTGQSLTMSGTTEANLNITATITVTGATTFTYTVASTTASGSGGVVSGMSNFLVMDPAASYNPGSGAVTGDFPASTIRYYKFAWADESTAIQLYGSDATYATSDARSGANAFPVGTFGGLSPVMSITSGGSDTLVSISGLLVLPPPDYNVTHIYVFASTEPESQSAAFYYVGKIAVNTASADYLDGQLFDTLSDTVLAERFSHTDAFVAMPSFEGACMWGQRVVGFTSADTYFSTIDHDIYFKVTTGSTVVDLTDSAGDPLDGNSGRRNVDWPRWVEQEGGNLFIDGVPQAEPILQKDTDSATYGYRIRLLQPWQGDTDASASGRVQGTNKLFIGIANGQLQEQAQVAFVINGDDAFNAPIRAVIAEQRGDTLLVFTEQSTYAIVGMASQESPSITNINSSSIFTVSRVYGCCGPLARCDGPQGVFVLTNSALVVATSQGVVDISNDLIRDWIREQDYQAKRDAVLAYDGTRGLLLAVIGDNCLVYDANKASFTVWVDARWRYLAVCDGRVAGLTGSGAGNKLLFQDAVADVTLLDEDMLCDKGLSGTVHFITATTVNVGATIINTPSVPNADIRGVYALVVVGTNAGSRALIISVASGSGGTQDITVGAWSAGNPSAGDRIALGPIVAQYQTGAIAPIASPRHRPVGARLVIDEAVSSSSAASATVWLRSYNGGESGNVPAYDAPTASAQKTLSRCRTFRELPMRQDKSSSLFVVGFDFAQPPTSRMKVQSVQFYTSEEAQEGA